MNGEQRAERMKTVINTRFERRRAHTHTSTQINGCMTLSALCVSLYAMLFNKYWAEENFSVLHRWCRCMCIDVLYVCKGWRISVVCSVVVTAFNNSWKKVRFFYSHHFGTVQSLRKKNRYTYRYINFLFWSLRYSLLCQRKNFGKVLLLVEMCRWKP